MRTNPSFTAPLGARMRSSAMRYCWPGSGAAKPASANAVLRFRGEKRQGRESLAVETAAVEEAQQLARLEAVLFLALEPLSTRKLAELAGLSDGTLARTFVKRLNSQYRSRGAALEAVEAGGGMRLMTRPAIADWLARVHGVSGDLRLSPAALETLAVTAYRQPVLRVEIESIRGVQCGEMLRVLMERDFLRIVGRSEELGRPFLYGTTRKFLQVFGLRRLEELPVIDQTLSAAAEVAETAAEAA